MDALEEFRHGLQAIRAYLDKNHPAWRRAEVSVKIEPHHAMMVLDAVEEDLKIETFETELVVGTFEDIDPAKEPAVPIMEGSQ